VLRTAVPKRERRDPFAHAHEPVPEGDDWVEWGGQLIWAAGFTSGGAPYGLSVEEWRRAMRRGESNAGWARARAVLAQLAREQSSRHSTIEIGRVTKVGMGLSRAVFAAALSVQPDDNGLSGYYAVLLPGSDPVPGLDQRVRTELRVLRALHDHAFPFRVPRPLGAVPEHYGLALAREFVPGIPLDLRAGRIASVQPWRVVAEIAAAVHGVNPPLPIDTASTCRTRRDHALEAIKVLEQLDDRDAKLARAWALEHLPPAEPAALLHGDLLGQNILLDPTASPRWAVIDWEYARTGDPAHDLAIVTRGVRKPFQIERGLELLLDAYEAASAGRAAVLKEHVRIHELALVATWYREALEGVRGHEPVEQAHGRLRRVLQMSIDAGRTKP
jgi:aminoglycoside phosphotransferase (APT) family kinase protein